LPRRYTLLCHCERSGFIQEGILETLWGEHIHLGYYDTEERKRGSYRKDFIKAKYDFIDKMMQWGGVNDLLKNGKSPAKVLDVGCGIGGTSRYLATKLGEQSEVIGITLSPKQVSTSSSVTPLNIVVYDQFAAVAQALAVLS
jgi:MPBQ/MSBQ methyltransferase